MPLAREMTAVYDQHGGQIGRNAANSLVLEDADKIVSGRHAEIMYQNGQYFIKDTSSNGTLLQNAGQHLNNAQAVLQNNEILRIGEYEVLVEIASEAFHANELNAAFIPEFPELPGSAIGGGAHFVSQSPFGEQEPLGEQPLFAGQSPFGSPSPFMDQSPLHDSFSLPNVMAPPEQPKDIADFLKGLESLSVLDNPVKIADSGAIAPLPGDPFAKAAQPPFVMQDPGAFLAQPSAVAQDFRMPQPASNTRPAGPAFTSATPASPPLKNALQANAELIQHFLQGAGIKDSSFLQPDQATELMKSLGDLFRIMVEGLMDVLRARAEMKSEFRVAVTTIRSLDNNPLKFNPDVESVLKLLMAPNNPAYINPKDAVSEAFKDIKYHQIAVTAGIQASLAEILHRFDPEVFEKVYEEGVVFQKKAKCWDLYCDKYPELRTLAQEDFFGEEFANAYERQMRLFGRH